MLLITELYKQLEIKLKLKWFFQVASYFHQITHLYYELTTVPKKKKKKVLLLLLAVEISRPTSKSEHRDTTINTVIKERKFDFDGKFN